MPLFRTFFANLLPWLLAPLLAFGGIRVEFCGCAHGQNGDCGESVGSAEVHSHGVDHAVDHATSNSHAGTAFHAGIHAGHDSVEQACSCNESCECVEVDETQELPLAVTGGEAPKVTGAALVPSAMMPGGAEMDPLRAPSAQPRRLLVSSSSPPLFLLNCTFRR